MLLKVRSQPSRSSAPIESNRSPATAEATDAANSKPAEPVSYGTVGLAAPFMDQS